jgi:hypothetical protein
MGKFKDTIGQGGFAVVNVGDDGKIADKGEIGHGGGVVTMKIGERKEKRIGPGA